RGLLASGLALPQRRRDDADLAERAGVLLDAAGLAHMADRPTESLSFGEERLLELCRALAVEPRVLLLDEPFGALDAKVRYELRRWLRQLHDDVGVTSVFVTHDQEEALEVADQVAILNGGRIEQVGAPDEVYNRPASSFVYNFLGNVNLFHGRIDNGTAYINQEATGQLVFVRPHSLEIGRQPSGANYFRATIKHISSAGPVVKVDAATAWGAPVHVEMAQARFRELELRTGEEIFITPKDIAVFADEQRAG
ncbi:MAG: TOBE-like domain-containing protein, partial [Candidatus Eremiobacteraeota bacterium]|nr:TOBE-like domain-containing protein [Candidatus Eremiobacteraeota bacterium]